MADDAPFTTADLAACAEREVKQRRRVYPRLIMSGRMSSEQAARETEMMVEIARRLQAEVAANPQQAGRLL